jgi:hypothetical protein
MRMPCTPTNPAQKKALLPPGRRHMLANIVGSDLLSQEQCSSSS